MTLNYFIQYFMQSKSTANIKYRNTKNITFLDNHSFQYGTTLPEESLWHYPCLQLTYFTKNTKLLEIQFETNPQGLKRPKTKKWARLLSKHRISRQLPQKDGVWGDESR